MNVDGVQSRTKLLLHNTPLAEPAHGGQYTGTTQSDTLQALVVLHVQNSRFRLDELDVKTRTSSAGAAQDAAFGKNAKALVGGQIREAEQLPGILHEPLSRARAEAGSSWPAPCGRPGLSEPDCGRPALPDRVPRQPAKPE